MKKRCVLYGVYKPDGRLYSVEDCQWNCKVRAFDAHDEAFRSKYWNKATPAWNAAKKEGWRIVKGYFKESPRGK